MNRILSFVLAIVVFASVAAQGNVYPNAQNNPKAERSVRSAISLLKKNAYQSTFSAVYYNAQRESKNVQRGTLTTSGNMFNLTIGGVETKYDGLTQWVFVSQNNEVTITEPGAAELADSNPIILIERYAQNNRINYDDEQEDENEVINFFPKNDIKKSEFFKITLRLSRKTHLPKSILVFMRNGDKISFVWEELKLLNLTDNSMFVFNPKDYVNVDINDLR